jgi:hypothetical protein
MPTTRTDRDNAAASFGSTGIKDVRRPRPQTRKLSRKRALRAGLIALAIPNTVVGGWLLLAPRSFYLNFPVVGLHWIEPLGAYSEHAFSDFGGALLAIALLTWVASLWLERRLVHSALLTVLFEALSHLIYHLTRLSAMSAVNDTANQLSLAYGVALSIALLILTSRMNWADGQPLASGGGSDDPAPGELHRARRP